MHFVDKRRVAVWGWSYGGFVAALVLAHPEQKVFQCGISVAPIVSWELYGTVNHYINCFFENTQLNLLNMKLLILNIFDK